MTEKTYFTRKGTIGEKLPQVFTMVTNGGPEFGLDAVFAFEPRPQKAFFLTFHGTKKIVVTKFEL